MSFARAFVIAVMAGVITRSDDLVTGAAVAWLVGGVAWLFLTDPLPGAIRRGLEAYAKDYRK